MAIADAQQRLQQAIAAYQPVADQVNPMRFAYPGQGQPALGRGAAVPEGWLTDPMLRSWYTNNAAEGPGAQAAAVLPQLDRQTAAYNDVLAAYQDLAAAVAAQYPPGTDEAVISADPRIEAAYNQVVPLYNDGRFEGVRDASGRMVSPPPFNTGHGSSGLTSALKMALPAALSFFATPALGGALGSALGSASLGSALAGAGIGGLTSAISGSNPLVGAGLGGIGGYLGGGGWSDMGLPTIGDVGDALGVGDFFASGPGGSSSAPAGGYLGGGGTGGGFFTSLDDSVLGPDFYNGLRGSAGDIGAGLNSLSPGGLAPTVAPSAFSPAASAASGVASAAASSPSFLSDPGAYLWDQAKTGLADAFSPASLLTKGIKGGLAYTLQKDNDAGFNALQGAATRTADNYAQVAQNYAPWITSGQAAQRLVADLNGLNGAAARAAAMAGFQADPGYQFGLNEGIKAIDSSAARRGMLLSGNNQQAIQDYGTGLAQSYFDKYYGRLAGQANQGYQAVGSQGNAYGQLGAADLDAQSAYAAKKKQGADRFNSMLKSILA